jgi:hypothetical protein
LAQAAITGKPAEESLKSALFLKIKMIRRFLRPPHPHEMFEIIEILNIQRLELNKGVL